MLKFVFRVTYLARVHLYQTDLYAMVHELCLKRTAKDISGDTGAASRPKSFKAYVQ